GEPPDAAHRGPAVVQRAADAMELAAVELPDQHAVHVAAERDLLDRYVDVLAEARMEARVPCRHRAGRGDHLRVKSAGVERFLDRRQVRLARQTQRAAHRGRDELAAAPAGALAAAAER